eukprot:TRINITY_DN1208_c0_g1_i2.p1 TRINITY_DN1208_c0_g1~~TRINITY_DN1208_c0_g1_i2.p1  ORF type:complete len:578 (-),score=97.44 TRINITY_DN1208_c0_g1_i2:597-2330(-)
MGAASLIVWCLIVVVCIKYCIFVLAADHDGEGGTFALAAQLESLGPRKRKAVFIAAMFGGALVLADGVITPAISVLSAVSGLATYTPQLAPAVVPLSLLILLGLFLVQRFGTARVSIVFGPIMLLWFVALFVIGTYQVTMYPHVLSAFNPVVAVQYFVRNGGRVWPNLGLAVLAVTGVETMFADMGHFGVGPIRFSWFALVMPALMMNYLGQCALLMRIPAAVTYAFYLSCPYAVFWPMLVLSTVATVIASQAVITCAFTLLDQAVSLRCAPRLKTVHTSRAVAGQIYISEVNYALMIGVILIVLAFQNASNLSNAYGVAVTGIMTLTTVLLAIIMYHNWKWPLFMVIPLTLVLLFVDVNFFAACLTKVPQGGWLSLVIGGFFGFLMVIWYFAQRKLDKSVHATAIPLASVLQTLQSAAFPRTSGLGVFITNDHKLAVPEVFAALLERFGAAPQTIAFCTVTVLRSVPFARSRVTVEAVNTTLQMYDIKIQFGYAERDCALSAIITQLIVEGRLPNISQRTLFFAGSHVVEVSSRNTIWRRAYLGIFRFLMRFSASPTAFLQLPPNSTMLVADLTVL